MTALATGCVLLVVLAPATQNAFWGVNFWSLWAIPWRIAAVGLGLAGIGFASRISWLCERRFVPQAVIGALTLFWILVPSGTLLFGDAMEVAGRIGSDTAVTPRSPLYSFIVHTLGRMAGPHHPVLLGKAVQWISVLCGLVTGLLLLRLWKTRYRGMGLVFIGVFLGGYIGLFQSYVEAYGMIVAALCGYMTLLFARPGTTRAIALLVAQALVILAHLMGVMLVPVTLWVLFERRSWRTKLLAGVLVMGLFILALLLRSGGAGAALALIPPPSFFSRQLGYLVHPPAWSAGFFSVWHPIDIVNGYLLSVGPAVVLGLALAFTSRGRTALARAFRSPAGTVTVLFVAARCLVITPLGGPVLDWDLFAAFGFPLAFFVAEAWKTSDFKPASGPAGAILVIVAVLSVAPLAAMLASSSAATERVVAYGSGSPNPRPFVQAQIAHHLGDQAARTGDANAPKLFSLAFQLDPNPVYARRAGEAWRRAGQSDKAIEEFTHAIDRDSSDVVSLGQRAFLWLGRGDAARAENDFNAVLRRSPGNLRSLYGLGLVAGAKGNPELKRARMEAVVQTIRDELARGEKNSWLYSDLGSALYQLGRYQDAITNLNQALAIQPDRPSDWSTLGDCYRSLSQTDEAERAYRKARDLTAGAAGTRAFGETER